jgi:hypothetical protein
MIELSEKIIKPDLDGLRPSCFNREALKPILVMYCLVVWIFVYIVISFPPAVNLDNPTVSAK